MIGDKSLNGTFEVVAESSPVKVLVEIRAVEGKASVRFLHPSEDSDGSRRKSCTSDLALEEVKPERSA